jgi:hypothetical protein
VHVEPYNPETHEALLQHWAEVLGRPFNPDALSRNGYVVKEQSRLLMAIFAYRDPTSQLVFVDNLQADREAPVCMRLAAIRCLLRAVHEHLVSEGVRIIRFTTNNRAIRWLFATAGVVPFGENQSAFIMRIGGHNA